MNLEKNSDNGKQRMETAGGCGTEFDQ